MRYYYKSPITFPKRPYDFYKEIEAKFDNLDSTFAVKEATHKENKHGEHYSYDISVSFEIAKKSDGRSQELSVKCKEWLTIKASGDKMTTDDRLFELLGIYGDSIVEECIPTYSNNLQITLEFKAVNLHSGTRFFIKGSTGPVNEGFPMLNEDNQKLIIEHKNKQLENEIQILKTELASQAQEMKRLIEQYKSVMATVGDVKAQVNTWEKSTKTIPGVRVLPTTGQNGFMASKPITSTSTNNNASELSNN